MRTYTVTEYSREDMLALDDMSEEEVESAIMDLDRGYFNRYLFPESDDEDATYSEDEYNAYRIRVALRKVYQMVGEKI